VLDAERRRITKVRMYKQHTTTEDGEGAAVGHRAIANRRSS
jgi:hypothetical protein